MTDTETHAKKLDLLGAVLITTVQIRAQLCHFSIINKDSGQSFDLSNVLEQLDQIDLELEDIRRDIERERVVRPAPVPPPAPRAISCPSCGGAPHVIPYDHTAPLTCRYCASSWYR